MLNSSEKPFSTPFYITLSIILIYFFFNSVFLPHGLLYTIILAPVFYIYAIKKKVKNILGYFLLTFVPFAVIHFINGVNEYFYFRSAIILLAIYLFGFGCHAFIKNNNIERYFPIILKVNFLLFLIALVLFFTPFAEAMWTFKNLTKTIKNFPRLELLTYEPSYYSLILSPIAIYYLLHLFILPTRKNQVFAYFFMIALPFAFSFSFGVIGGIAIAFFLLFIFKYKELSKQRYFYYTFWGVIILLFSTFAFVLIAFPENAITVRIIDLIEGRDTSALGRTTNAFWLANLIVNQKSVWFGVGLGQIKLIGAQLIKEFYNYSIKDSASLAIPNSVGETIAMFGYFGLILKLFLQFYLFKITKTSSNYFRLTIFIFIFIYQFTGSFFNNSAEIVLWVLAFSPCCHKFDRSNFIINTAN